ncbi:hypothetical protein [Pedobacter sp. Hv1]|uniref:hypothetical protein n=1 Tax=Pedobacter sp. Hv1 TaxID=1740090 RepID=UPI0006D8AE32|nr:hypothetical protein [Pedobacter sp. Hv1]KQB99994.1 hypothetical protein AQF98_15935 [Pedobacter sp. Hv1]
MRKFIFMMLLCTAFGVKYASAQGGGLNNNSDLRVPVPGSVNTTAPYIRVIVPTPPAMPPMPGVPAISPVPTLPSGGLLPAVPQSPALPAGPSAGSAGGAPTGPAAGGPPAAIGGILPNLPILPPVPPIPPLPEVRLPSA